MYGPLTPIAFGGLCSLTLSLSLVVLQLKTLRHQQAHGTHGATSAMELVREFLDQAQLVADEGNGRNNRYHALLRVAAQVALQMEIPLENVETQLPAHFQRLLLDGIVDLAEAEDDGASKTKAKDPAMITVAHAHLLHQRWTLRTLVRESQNGYLTSTNKNDAEEQMSGFQVALSELAQHHLQIAQSLQQTLADDPRDALPLQAQFDAFYDLAVYFFSFNAYEKAYECFSRAFELVEDHGSGSLAQLPTAQRASLEGYLAACESVLEARSGGSGGGDTVMADADARDDGPFGNALLLDGDEAAPSEQAMDSRTEALLRAGAKRQRDHYRVVNDIHGLFTAWQHDDAAGATRTDPAALASTLRRAILSKTDSTTLPDDRGRARNLVVFLMLHSCWDALAHWRELLPSDHVVWPLVGFANACGSLVQYVATTVNGSPADGDYRQNFSVTRCNSILSELLTKRRELLSEHGINPGDDSDASNGPLSTDGEIAALLVDLPLWVMDTLVCVCAGLLHRSSMRSLSDHRVSFDLNPYGDVALLVAFAHENPKKKSDDDPTGVGDAQLPTTPFLKATLPEIVALHARGVQCLVRRCPREPRWHSARADLTLYPIVRLKQPSLSGNVALLSSMMYIYMATPLTHAQWSVLY
jgi:hypothetical protein